MSLICPPSEALELQSACMEGFVPVIAMLGNLNAISNHLMMAFVSSDSAISEFLFQVKHLMCGAWALKGNFNPSSVFYEKEI